MKQYFEDTKAPLDFFNIPVRTKRWRGVVKSASGIFSAKRVDKGTQTLIDYCEVAQGASVLDLGCGCGVIGKVIQEVFEAQVTCVDVNPRAISVAKKNLKATFVLSNAYEMLMDTFDVILTNPPYVAGRKVVFSFVEGAVNHLRKGGSLQVVARHNKGGKMIELRMQEVFGNVEVLGKSGGYRVYKSIKLK